MLTQNLPCLVKLQQPPFFDERGFFKKIMTNKDLECFLASHFSSQFIIENPWCGFKEIFMNKSKPFVVRGFHYQAKPHAVWKFIFCIDGSSTHNLFEVPTAQVTQSTGMPALSPSSQKLASSFSIHSYRLSANDNTGLLIPPGYAHAFQAEESGVELLYMTDQNYDSTLDTGFSWKGFEDFFPYPKKAILSSRDQSLPTLNQV